jgi:hypothetical protein
MVDHKLAQAATVLLSTAINAIFEEVKPAISASLQDDTYAARTADVERMGGDVAILGAAIGVLARRAGAKG